MSRVNHMDTNPADWTKGETYDAYMDMMHRANNIATENCELAKQLAEARALIEAIIHLGSILELRDESIMSLAPGDPETEWYQGDLDEKISEMVIDARAFLAKPAIQPRLDYRLTAKEEERDRKRRWRQSKPSSVS